jgi:ferredoxin-type protein NapH
VKRGDYFKWLIWVPWISSIVLLAIKAGGYNKIDFFYMTTHGLSVADIQSLISYFFDDREQRAKYPPDVE